MWKDWLTNNYQFVGVVYRRKVTAAVPKVFSDTLTAELRKADISMLESDVTAARISLDHTVLSTATTSAPATPVTAIDYGLLATLAGEQHQHPIGLRFVRRQVVRLRRADHPHPVLPAQVRREHLGLGRRRGSQVVSGS